MKTNTANNEKYEPQRFSNGETRTDLLTHVRYPLMKSGEDWTDFQKKEMELPFETEPRMKNAYVRSSSMQAKLTAACCPPAPPRPHNAPRRPDGRAAVLAEVHIQEAPES